MQNKMTDLNNHLFAQLERLSDEDLSGEELENEIKRAKAITGISSQIINNADVTIRAIEVIQETGAEVTIPEFLEPCTAIIPKIKRIG